MNVLQPFKNDVVGRSPEKLGELVEPGISGWRDLLAVDELEAELVDLLGGGADVEVDPRGRRL